MFFVKFYNFVMVEKFENMREEIIVNNIYLIA